MKEADLYPAVKSFLEARGYTVKGEIRECDVLAVRGQDEPLVVELKTTLSLDVLLQAVERLVVSAAVYVGVPLTCPALRRSRRKRVIRLLRMLGLGLLAVEPKRTGGIVEVLLDPGEYRPRPQKRKRQRLLGEFTARVGDPVPGGSDRRGKLLTAYRQRALRIAAYLRRRGPTKAAVVAAAVEVANARAILYDNVYGWFERTAPGIYALAERGRRELPGWRPARRKQ